MSSSMSRSRSLYGYDDLDQALPVLPDPPEHIQHSLFKRRSRSKSRSRQGALPSSFEDNYAHEYPAARSDYGQEALFPPEGGSDDDGSAVSVGMFSRSARSAARQQRTRSYYQPAPPSPTSPTSPAEEALDHLLFAPSFTPRQLARLSRAGAHVEAHDAHAAKKEKGRERRGQLRGEVKVAMGVLEMVGQERKEKRKAKGRSQSHGRTVAGQEEHAGGGEEETTQQRLFGLFEQVEERFVGGPSPPNHPCSTARPPAPNVYRSPSLAAAAAPHSPSPLPHHDNEDLLKKGLIAAGGAAALAGVVSAGFEAWEHYEREKKAKHAGAASVASAASTPHPAIRPASAASTAAARPPSSAARPALPPSLPPSPAPPSSHPALVSASTQTSSAPSGGVYLSALTPSQHHLVRHAAAALLLKDKARGTLHEAMHDAVGGVERMVRVVEAGVEEGWERAMHHGGGKRPEKLFGTPLKTLTAHEGVDSFHGSNPHGTVRIPEFVDHCITALMQMDMTTEGIFRKSGNLRVIDEIVHALDSSGGNDTVIDLAALDPITLADIFKRFLRFLPDPVLSGHLFKLFIACSHIHHPTLRRRAMHLVVCLMPKANEHIMEVVFLFLDWLSTYGHIDVKVGNQMDLSAIARVMAPTLLRPHGRDPKPAELPAMVAAVLQLLEDQHYLHQVPLELAQVLHIQVPHEVHHGDSAGLVQHLARLL
ncbi:hypothetical protein JCM8097_002031 [Rhodosporidiobolus ruineniae]